MRNRWIGATLAIGLIAAAAVFWFSELAPTDGIKSACITPARSMAQAIEARMHDGRIHVSDVKVVEAHDDRYENLFFTSAKVRVAGVGVGIGTWASNVSDFGAGEFRGWEHTPSYYTLGPVNDLARAISSFTGVLNDPGMTRAARYSQGCTTGSVGPSK